MNTHSTTESRDRLVSSLRSVIRDAEDLLKASGEQASDSYDNARSRLQSTMESARAGLTNAKDTISARSRDVAYATDDYVQENPWRSIGMAAIVGIAVGMLLSYGRDNYGRGD